MKSWRKLRRTNAVHIMGISSASDTNLPNFTAWGQTGGR